MFNPVRSAADYWTAPRASVYFVRTTTTAHLLVQLAMMRGLSLLLLGAAGAQAQTVCEADINQSGVVDVEGALPAPRHAVLT